MPHLIAHAQRSNIRLFSAEPAQYALDATLTLGDTSKGPRPKKFMVIHGGKELPKRPAEVVGVLRQHNVTLAERDRATPREQKVFRDLIELFEAYQISYDRVHVCGFCIGKRRYKPANANFVSYEGERICMDCAQTELRRELSFRGFARYNHFYALLNKVRDLDRVLHFLYSGVDPDLTRYDVLSRRVESYQSVAIDELNVDERLKVLLKQRLSKLLPAQSMAVERGLFKGRDLLVVSATATGKTLIGELAGVNNALSGRGKLLFVVPLVALANQKYSEFDGRYRDLGLSASIRIGSSRIRTREWMRVEPDYSADILVGTYEGIDQVLRTNNAELLGKIGTIVVDEVHMLEDEERGSRLDGLISRLKALAPRSQRIYLSATVGNPLALARELGAELVEYEDRPVPIERHLVFAPDHEKLPIINKLVRYEIKRTSSKGYKGQSIVFTNSRVRCHKISKALSAKSAPYHGGLAYAERKKVETNFANGNIDVVVTTAALGAGVDFPASQVIFESLAMGINWLTVQEFHQMLGRAGRPDYHDIGKVVLLAEPDKKFRGPETEDQVAIKLLTSAVEGVEIAYDDDQQAEQTLANLTFGQPVKMLVPYDAKVHLHRLKRLGFVSDDGQVTKLGKIVSGDFLTIDEAVQIVESVKKGNPPLEIVLKLHVFTAVYLNDVQRIAQVLGGNISPNVFSGGNLEMFFSGSGDELTYLDQKALESVLAFSIAFVDCDCEESPFCGCPERSFSKWVIDQRISGLDPAEIVEQMSTFGVHAYSGDVLNYLDQAVRLMESIEAMATILRKKEITRQALQIKLQLER
jgi:putative ATP-dependent RNA helicase